MGMISDLISQWPWLVPIAALAAVVIALLSCWLSRATITMLAGAVEVITENILANNERIKDMATQNGNLSTQLADTREELTQLKARHNALVEKVDSGFERIETDIDRLKTTVVDVRLGMKDLQVGNAGSGDGSDGS